MKPIVQLDDSDLRVDVGTEDWAKIFDSNEKYNDYPLDLGEVKKSIMFGLNMDGTDYNIFCVGHQDTEMDPFTTKIVQEFAEKSIDAKDYCYVHNFAKPDYPRLLWLDAGKGSSLSLKLDRLIDQFYKEFNEHLLQLEYDNARRKLIEEYTKHKQALLTRVETIANTLGLRLHWNSSSFTVLPIVSGEEITEDEYRGLSPEVKKEIAEKTEKVNQLVYTAVNRIVKEERKIIVQIEQLERQAGVRILQRLLGPLQEEFASYPQVVDYFRELREDLLVHLHLFKEDMHGEEGVNDYIKSLTQYKVNVFVANRPGNGRPVIVENHPSYHNLFGSIDYTVVGRNMVWDFSLIKPGSVHLANGGYLILQARDVIQELWSWDALKKVLKSGILVMENLSSQLGFGPSSPLRPDSCPIQLKVIMFGSREEYDLLYHYDEDFSHLFKVKVEFEDQCQTTKEQLKRLGFYVRCLNRDMDYKPLDPEGFQVLVQYSCRLAGSRKKMTTHLKKIKDLVREAKVWSDLDGKGTIEKSHLVKAWEEMKSRKKGTSRLLSQHIQEEKLLLTTRGGMIGQVNGLAVLDVGDDRFGYPVKITCSTWIGKQGVVHIEREVRLSGRIHSKGVLVLSGYLGHQYGQRQILNFSASICLEQLYQAIDGDSASLGELYALMSSLGSFPIDQGIAVTGSLSQRGEVQPVGGINEKIEGFFSACQIQGLTGEQGVIIPVQNVGDLVVEQGVADAVRKGMFHIYPITNVDEGIEILVRMSAGGRNQQGEYPEGSIHYLVSEGLGRFSQTMSTD